MLLIGEGDLPLDLDPESVGVERRIVELRGEGVTHCAQGPWEAVLVRPSSIAQKLGHDSPPPDSHRVSR